MSIAAQHSTAFKEATQTLEGSQRVILESSIRQTVGANSENPSIQAQTIDLKMDF